MVSLNPTMHEFVYFIEEKSFAKENYLLKSEK